MFNVGGPELLVIILVALVVLGPQQLPKAMRTFGSVMAEVRKVSDGFQAEMRNAMDSVTDTTATEKPHSGSMADATPPAAPEDEAPAVEAGDSDVTKDEVVARNDGAPATDPVSDRPPVDPADRAAG